MKFKKNNRIFVTIYAYRFYSFEDALYIFFKRLDYFKRHHNFNNTFLFTRCIVSFFSSINKFNTVSTLRFILILYFCRRVGRQKLTNFKQLSIQLIQNITNHIKT